MEPGRDIRGEVRQRLGEGAAQAGAEGLLAWQREGHGCDVHLRRRDDLACAREEEVGTITSGQGYPQGLSMDSDALTCSAVMCACACRHGFAFEVTLSWKAQIEGAVEIVGSLK